MNVARNKQSNQLDPLGNENNYCNNKKTTKNKIKQKISFLFAAKKNTFSLNKFKIKAVYLKYKKNQMKQFQFCLLISNR